MSKVTVVIPNYNGKRFIEGCLRAVLSQAEGTPSYDVLVVDNGSDDGSEKYLRELGNDRVRTIFLKKNTGFCHAVNVGIRESKAPFVILLNNDTEVESGFVRALYEAIKDRKKVFSVSAKMLMWDSAGRIDDAGDLYTALGWHRARGKGEPEERYDRPARIFSSCGGAAIYRKSVFERIGLFDEAHFAYLEDLDIGYRASLCGYVNLYEPKARVLHYGSGTTGSRYNETKIRLSAANNIYVIAKNMPVFQVLLNLPFLCAGFFAKFLFFAKKGYGRVYLKGLYEGVKKSCSEEGRRKRFIFKFIRLPHYIVVQAELYLNIFRLIIKKY
ncbi:MAG: glycosyltransferase family 2 protein [Lachnospiraceae bacterium]|nr:glycosyltransferase family 2 protein [Lachnospiraceae bacterium]